jgi:hypothetical protein
MPLTSTEIGRDYERYVGYLYESRGWSVIYRGILKGFRDKGRDLVCAKEGVVHIVQCKCWRREAEVGEEVIRRLLGTTHQYRQWCHNPMQTFLGMPLVGNARVMARPPHTPSPRHAHSQLDPAPSKAIS